MANEDKNEERSRVRYVPPKRRIPTEVLIVLAGIQVFFALFYLTSVPLLVADVFVASLGLIVCAITEDAEWKFLCSLVVYMKGQEKQINDLTAENEALRAQLLQETKP